MCLWWGFKMARTLRITLLEPKYPILRRVQDMNHMGNKLWSMIQAWSMIL